MAPQRHARLPYVHLGHLLVMLASVAWKAPGLFAAATPRQAARMVNRGLRVLRKQFLRGCRGRSPGRLQVLTVADRLIQAQSANEPLSACYLAQSLAQVGGGKLGVLGLTHSRRASRRARDFWQQLLLRHLGQQLDDEMLREIPNLLAINLSFVSLFLLDYLETLENSTLILFVDAFDVLLQKSPEDIVRAYCEYQWEAQMEQLVQGGTRAAVAPKSIGQECLVFAAEDNCHPFPNFWSKRGGDFVKAGTSEAASRRRGTEGVCFELERLAKGKRRFLNGGAVIGRAGDLRRFLHSAADAVRLGEPSNQGAWQLALLQNPTAGVLDQDARIFLPLHLPLSDGSRSRLASAVDGVENVPCHLFAAATRSRDNLHNAAAVLPAVLHFNGNAKRRYAECRSTLLGVAASPFACDAIVDLDKRWNWSAARLRNELAQKRRTRGKAVMP